MVGSGILEFADEYKKKEKKTMRKLRDGLVLLFLLAMALFCTRPALAQTAAEPPRVTLSGAYSLLRTGIGVAGGGNAHVLLVSPTVRLTKGDSTKGFAVSGRFDYLRGNAPDFQSLQFGPEARRNLSALLPSSDYFKAEKFEFFGNVLAGFNKYPRPDGSTDTDFSWSFGGGLDFTDTHAERGGAKVTIRAFEAKFVRAKGLGGGLRLQNDFVASTGLTLRF
jgi:hypothetical protein